MRYYTSVAPNAEDPAELLERSRRKERRLFYGSCALAGFAFLSVAGYIALRWGMGYQIRALVWKMHALGRRENSQDFRRIEDHFVPWIYASALVFAVSILMMIIVLVWWLVVMRRNRRAAWQFSQGTFPPRSS